MSRVNTKPKPPSREEIAAIEVGRTDINRGHKLMLIFLFLALILGVPAAEIARDLSAGTTPKSLEIVEIIEDSAHAGESSDSWLDRSLARNSHFMSLKDTYEDSLTKESLLSDLLVPPAQNLLFSLGVGNGDVVCGRDGWLFFKPGVDSILGRPFLEAATREGRIRSSKDMALSPDPVLAIYEFAAALAERGIVLVVVPAPTKLAIHPERLSQRFDANAPALANPSRAQFVEELADFERVRQRYRPHAHQAKGLTPEHRSRMWFAQDLARFEALEASEAELRVMLFDPAPVLVAARKATGKPQYLATDSHWRPEAAARVAEVLSQHIAALNLLESRAPLAGSAAAEVKGRGDLSRMLDLAVPVSALTSEAVILEAVPKPESETPPEVLLLGDSFTNIYSAAEMGWGEGSGFGDQLARYLGRPIEVIARNDSGAHSTRAMLARDLAQGTDRLAGKKICIWEFAERELSIGDWRHIPLGSPLPVNEPATDSAAPLLELSSNDRIEVSGTVLRVTSAPRPGSVPYKDHIVYAEVVDLESSDADRALSSRRALVALYSMRDNVWTEAARWRAGENVHLVVQSYDQKNQELGLDAINSTMFDDDLAYELPVWGEAIAKAPEPDAASSSSHASSTATASWFAVVLAIAIAAIITWLVDWKEQRQSA